MVHNQQSQSQTPLTKPTRASCSNKRVVREALYPFPPRRQIGLFLGKGTLGITQKSPSPRRGLLHKRRLTVFQKQPTLVYFFYFWKYFFVLALFSESTFTPEQIEFESLPLQTQTLHSWFLSLFSSFNSFFLEPIFCFQIL